MTFATIPVEQRQKEAKALRSSLVLCLVGSVVLHVGAVIIGLNAPWDSALVPENEPIEFTVVEPPEVQPPEPEEKTQAVAPSPQPTTPLKEPDPLETPTAQEPEPTKTAPIPKSVEQPEQPEVAKPVSPLSPAPFKAVETNKGQPSNQVGAGAAQSPAIGNSQGSIGGDRSVSGFGSGGGAGGGGGSGVGQGAGEGIGLGTGSETGQGTGTGSGTGSGQGSGQGTGTGSETGSGQGSDQGTGTGSSGSSGGGGRAGASIDDNVSLEGMKQEVTAVVKDGKVVDFKFQSTGDPELDKQVKRQLDKFKKKVRLPSNARKDGEIRANVNFGESKSLKRSRQAQEYIERQAREPQTQEAGRQPVRPTTPSVIQQGVDVPTASSTSRPTNKTSTPSTTQRSSPKRSTPPTSTQTPRTSTPARRPVQRTPSTSTPVRRAPVQRTPSTYTQPVQRTPSRTSTPVRKTPVRRIPSTSTPVQRTPSTYTQPEQRAPSTSTPANPAPTSESE